jgi:broad specificity phosphatase PhoE
VTDRLGFDGLAGAGHRPSPVGPPDGVRTQSLPPPGATRIVLIRHGEAVCNVSGVCGGIVGCQGLTARGREQVDALSGRLAESGELAGADALYASILPRAIETAERLAPALAGRPGPGSSSPRPGPPGLVTECDLCELHPGEADGLSWDQFITRFGPVDWDSDPDRTIAPGGESWTGFVRRVDRALDVVADRHPGQLVVVATHAGVIEASLLSKLPVAGGRDGARLRLRTEHASLTTWEVSDGRWLLLGYNDVTPPPTPIPTAALDAVQQA